MTMIKPYYQEDNITIFCANCLDIMPQLEPVDLVLTDPPYNVNKDYGEYKDNLTEKDYEMWMANVAQKCLNLAKNQAWVAPRYKMLTFLKIFRNSHIIVVRRGARGPYRGGWSDQFSTILITGKPNNCEVDLWENIRLKGEGFFFREDTFGHPGYTPLPIMVKCIELMSQNSVLDPFMGTGTSLVAAKKLGRKAIGIEISRTYCDIAIDRLSQQCFNFSSGLRDME